MNLVREVDHFFIQTDQPEVVFERLQTDLGLPSTWPLAEYEGHSSGGLWIGNSIVEVVRFHKEPLGGDRLGEIKGVALVPALPLAELLEEIESLSIANEASTWKAPDQEEAIFGHVLLPSLAGEDARVFFVQYPFNAMAFSEAQRDQLSSASPRTMSEAKELLRSSAEAKPIGPVGILGVEEIVVGTTDLRAARRDWNKLAQSQDDLWGFGYGPAIRLVQSERDAILQLVVNVGSLAQAQENLRTCSALDGGLLVELVDGVSARLVQPAMPMQDVAE